MGKKSIQKTVYNGIFKIHTNAIGFDRGVKIVYQEEDKKTEMSMEEFAAHILENMVFVKSLKQRAPKVKIISKIDISDFTGGKVDIDEFTGRNEEDSLEHKEETGEV